LNQSGICKPTKRVLFLSEFYVNIGSSCRLDPSDMDNLGQMPNKQTFGYQFTVKVIVCSPNKSLVSITQTKMVFNYEK
jgi:hypothetical protein